MYDFLFNPEKFIPRQKILIGVTRIAQVCAHQRVIGKEIDTFNSGVNREMSLDFRGKERMKYEREIATTTD